MPLPKCKKDREKYLPEDGSTTHVEIKNIIEVKSKTTGGKMTKVIFKDIENNFPERIIDFFGDNIIGFKKAINLYNALGIEEKKWGDIKHLLKKIVKVKLKIKNTDNNIFLNVVQYYPPDKKFKNQYAADVSFWYRVTV